MDTPEARYDQLTDRVAALYDEGLQQLALDLVVEVEPDLQPWSAELAHLHACLLGSLDRPAEALTVLQNASAAGGWWDAGLLTEDDDLAALQNLPAFQELVALSRSRRVTAQDPPLIRLPAQPPAAEAAEGEAAEREAAEAPLRGVVVALHGAGQRASHAMRDWAVVLDHGYALVAVESSQLMSPMYRTWPDPEIARTDIARAIADIPKDLPVIAAGFSAGGRVALDWALRGQPEPVAGVVVLAPAIRELPAEAQGSLEPASLLIGTEDDLLEVVDEEQLAKLGITVHKLPGLGHEFPDAGQLGEYIHGWRRS